MDMIQEFQWAESMNCAVTVCDKEGVILYMNAPARELYRKHGDLIGTNLRRMPFRAFARYNPPHA